MATEQKTADTIATAAIRGSAGERLGLLALTGDTGHTFPLPPSGDVTIGRSREADIHVAHESLSRKHAALRLGPVPAVKDLGSSNGTRVKGKAVGDQWVTVEVGEAFELGEVTFLLQRSATVHRVRRLWSHGYFESRLEEECERGPDAFAVLRLQVGAPAQARAAEVLSRELRAGDCLAAYAPDELEALLLGAGAAEAQRTVQAVAAALGGEPVRAGIACFPVDGKDPELLLQKAGIDARVSGEKPIPQAGPVVLAPAMKQLFALVDRVAAGAICVLVTGETGTGKEVVAHAIHQRSPRAKKAFLTLNCGAFTESLLESELFGHEKGAFTGATEAKEGLFESAQGGTVFLDELGELSPSTQVKLLRVLEERAVRRVGSVKVRPIDVRFVAATNRNLEEDVRAGRFREDLYFRIAGVTLSVPPLRERKEEIEPLARSFLTRFATQLARRVPELSPAALRQLEKYRWPGNIRELRNMMERAVLLCAGDQVTPEHLPPEKLSALWVDATPASPGDGAADRQQIIEALALHAGNQTQAAKQLGISRRTLLHRLDAYRLPRPQKKAP